MSAARVYVILTMSVKKKDPHTGKPIQWSALLSEPLATEIEALWRHRRVKVDRKAAP